jgi:hypothetical protein
VVDDARQLDLGQGTDFGIELAQKGSLFMESGTIQALPPNET